MPGPVRMGPLVGRDVCELVPVCVPTLVATGAVRVLFALACCDDGV